MLVPFLDTLGAEGAHAEASEELAKALRDFEADGDSFQKAAVARQEAWAGQEIDSGTMKTRVDDLALLAESSRDLTGQADQLYELATRLVEICEEECDAKSGVFYDARGVTRARMTADEARQRAVEQLRQVRYFYQQAHWLTERFPDAELRDVEGLVKLVDRAEIEANDWSLTPGRYVGVAPEEEDEDFDFREALREIHEELDELNTEAVTLAATIKENFEELGI